MSRNDEHRDNWQDCQQGDVGRLVQRLQGRRRALATQQRMVAALLILMTVFTGYYFVGILPNAEPNYGGIVCSRVYELAPQFMAKTLDAESSARVKTHLERCRDCRRVMDEMSPQSASRSTPLQETLLRDTIAMIGYPR